MSNTADFTNKRAIRAEMKQKNRALGAEQRNTAADSIFRQVATLPAFQAAKCVAVFCALPDEPPTTEILRQWSLSKRIIVPRVEGDSMRFFDYDPQTQQIGAFGIEEPAENARLCPPAEIDLIVVPGVAFTADGKRLGRGRGYYDKYLSQPDFHASRIGVCYHHQLIDDLPTEPHDIFMELVVSNGI